MKSWRSGSSRDESPEASLNSLDGKAVGRALREEVRPVLRAAGFTSFTDRKAWRETDYTVDHVTLRSFNAYNAGVLGCTSYSVTIEVGVFYRCFNGEFLRPQDYDCTFRAILGKTIRQPYFATEWGPSKDEPTILYVQPDGSNLGQVVSESVSMLQTQGLPFVDRFNDPVRAFEALMTERMSDGDFGSPGVMFPGNPDSPNWREASLGIGHLIMDDPRSTMLSAPILRG